MAATLTMAYGLILLDMRLPDGEGITLCKPCAGATTQHLSSF